MSSYWLKQSSTKALFPDIEWTRPEQRSRAGKLAIVGGNKLSFVAVATAYAEATAVGAGQVRVVLPDALKPVIPVTILDTVFTASTPSGGMSKEDIGTVIAATEWADHTLCIGDAGRNSETAIVYETLLDSSKPMTVTRDAVDLLRSSPQRLVERPQTTLVLSFAQLQKLFQALYYPKMLSFSMQLNLLVDTLHKFTVSYPVMIVTYHQNQLLIAKDGQVITQEFDEPMKIWRGTVATSIATYLLWSPNKPLESATSAIFHLQ
ncbi:MAG: hypothetical protein ABIQ64_00860 [Candidatus Saccharimonadales bacterium]